MQRRSPARRAGAAMSRGHCPDIPGSGSELTGSPEARRLTKIIANRLRIYLAARDICGPTVLTTGAAGKVYTNIATTLHVLDAGGVREDSIPLAETGLQKEQVSSRTRGTLASSCSRHGNACMDAENGMAHGAAAREPGKSPAPLATTYLQPVEARRNPVLTIYPGCLAGTPCGPAPGQLRMYPPFRQDPLADQLWSSKA